MHRRAFLKTAAASAIAAVSGRDRLEDVTVGYDAEEWKRWVAG